VIRDHGFAAYTMSDIDDRGITDVTEEAMAEASAGVDGVHVSLDLDWLDPKEAPGVGTPSAGRHLPGGAQGDGVSRRDRLCPVDGTRRGESDAGPAQ